MKIEKIEWKRGRKRVVIEVFRPRQSNTDADTNTDTETDSDNDTDSLQLKV